MAGIDSRPAARSGRPVLVAGLCLVLCPPAARSLQERVADGPAAGIRIGSVVRIERAGGTRVEGRLVEADPDGVVLSVEGRRTAVGEADLERVWAGGRAVGQGAWIGALVVGVPALGFAALLCDALSEGTGCDEWGKVAAFGLLGGAAGAGAGAVVGAFVRTWDLRWSRAPVDAGLGLLAGRAVFGVAIRL